MSTLVLYLVVIFAAGLLAVVVRLPPLVGFLAAGFVLNAVGAQDAPILADLADLGVVLLLFGIGLKLDVRSLLRREVWLTTVAHMLVTIVVAGGLLALLGALGLSLVAGSSASTLALLGFALSFSSTVVVVKILEDRNDTGSLYGRTAIGVLVLQDVVAVVFLAASGGGAPSPWAAAVVLLVPAVPLFRLVWGRLDHGVMQVLFALLMALVPGYALFEAVGLKGELGALVTGLLLASDPRSKELAASIFSFKDLLLVAFFVSIGFAGLPTAQTVVIAAALLLLVPLKIVGFTALLWLGGFRQRSAVLGGTTLGQFSEFGLIVGAVGVSGGLLAEQWLVTLSLTVALSFVASALLTGRGSSSSTWLSRWLPTHRPDRVHPQDRPIDVGRSHVVVLGMGRVGSAAYRRLVDHHRLDVLGVEHDAVRVEQLRSTGVAVVEADATDADFWDRLVLAGSVGTVVLAMPDQDANRLALDQLRLGGFTGEVTAVAQLDGEAQELRKLGCGTALQLYDGAGAALADLAVDHDESDDEPPRSVRWASPGAAEVPGPPPPDRRGA